MRLRGLTLLLFAVNVFSVSAGAFQILSPVTDPCHEKILLGTFAQPAGFAIPGLASTTPLVARLLAKIEAEGVPQDRTTLSMMRENATRFSWQDKSPAELWLLTSLIAGIRSPDTSGFSIVDLNEVRNIHIRDAEQSVHALRASQDDFSQGNPQAISQTVTRLKELTRQMNEDWKNGLFQKKVRWNFAFYGPQDVQVFSAAFDLGLLAHTLQDGYSHTLRDDQLRVVAILNYVDAVYDQLNEDMDGPAHSDRMDECRFDQDDFDRMRVTEAARQSALYFNQFETLWAAQSSDYTAADAQLEDIFEFRDGCNIGNAYCGSTWYPISQSGLTEPYLGGCGSVHEVRSFRQGPPNLPPGNLALLALLFTLPLLTGCLLKRRTKLEKPV